MAFAEIVCKGRLSSYYDSGCVADILHNKLLCVSINILDVSTLNAQLGKLHYIKTNGLLRLRR